jgi:hypothetical protein
VSARRRENPLQNLWGLAVEKSLCRRFRIIRFVVVMKIMRTTLHKGEENHMTNEHLLLGDVARLLGVKPYRITYSLTTGLVPEPRTRIANKRIFDADDLARLADYFGVKIGAAADAGPGLDQEAMAQINTQ